MSNGLRVSSNQLGYPALQETHMSQTPDPRNQHRPALLNWLGYLAVALLLALPAAVLTVRAGAWQQGLLIYAIACAGAALLLLLAVLLMLLPRFAPWRKALGGSALIALPGTLLLLSLLGAGQYPRIHDISTDLQDPPVFTAAPQQRGPDSNSLDTAADTMELQAQAYPDLQTLRTAMDYDAMFDKAVQVATAMGWDIYLQDRNAGIIERTISSFGCAPMKQAHWWICGLCPGSGSATWGPMPNASRHSVRLCSNGRFIHGPNETRTIRALQTVSDTAVGPDRRECRGGPARLPHVCH